MNALLAQIVRGTYKGREGRVTTCQRKNFRIFVEGVSRDKGNGATVPIGVNASNVVITKLKLDKDRKNILSRKSTAQKSEDVEMKAVRSPIPRFCSCSSHARLSDFYRFHLNLNVVDYSAFPPSPCRNPPPPPAAGKRTL